MTKNKSYIAVLILVSILFLSSFDRDVTPKSDATLGNVRLGEETLCVSCHEETVRHYGKQNKAQSFYRPTEDLITGESRGLPYYHKPSRAYFDLSWVDDALVFSRYQKDKSGVEMNAIKQKVDWVMGSGDDVRTLLYQTGNGELCILPLAWYRDLMAWDMAPGFLNELTVTLEQPVTAACMFCHNAYPGDETDIFWSSAYFPHELPEGISCNRCHGDPSTHIELALAEGSSDADIKVSIVNPVKLDNPEREDVCNQCHLQPTVAVDAQRVFGRDAFSFVAGEPLLDYRIEVDITNVQRNGERTFEKNHHAYQLYQSRCYTASEGLLSCMTCHSIHNPPAEPEKSHFFNDRCLTCHEGQKIQSLHNNMTTEIKDCVSCHMPQSRTHNYVHMTTTDHRIRVVPDLDVLLEEREEEDILIRSVMSYNLPELDTTKKIYLAIAVLNMTKKKQVLNYVKNLLEKENATEVMPYLYVAEAEMANDLYENALESLEAALVIEPENPVAIEWKGVTLMKLKRMDEARVYLDKAIQQVPERAECHYNMGLYHFYHNDLEKAEVSFHESLARRSNFKVSWYYLSLVHLEKKEYTEAERCSLEALKIDPAHTRSYLALKDALVAQGKKDEAKRYLEHAYDIVPHEVLISQELYKLSQE